MYIHFIRFFISTPELLVWVRDVLYLNVNSANWQPVTLVRALTDIVTVNKLTSYFDNYLALDDKEKEELTNRVIEKNIKRKQFILQEGDVCRHYSFVVSGCFKMYGVDESGKEHNIQFALENEWISDIGSFHSEKGSQLFIEAIEPSIILQLEKSNLIYFYTHYPKFNRTFRVIIEDKFVELQKQGFTKNKFNGRRAIPFLFRPIPTTV